METASIDESSLSKLVNHRKPDKAERILVSSDFLRTTRSNLPATSGKVYFVMNGKNYLCSGSVVNAGNRDMVVPAGHCVFDYEQQMWASNWIFVPEYSSNYRPHGTFIWRQMATKQGWTNNQDYNFDVGIVLMNTNENGQHIQDLRAVWVSL
ncbi:unnamed protein product [Rotaria sp. Silwood2]|nr:unnamed protein product [Rotaria sp. Silwood2]